MKVRLSYDYGGDTITLEGDITESGQVIYAVTSNPTFIPSDGTLITISTQGDLSYEYRSYVPALNNVAYYLFTDNNSPTLADFIAGGTSITMTLDAGMYIGDFTYSNPDEYSNLFVALNLNNTLDISDTTTFDMLAGTSMVVDTQMSGAGGVFELEYATDAGGVIIALEQNGNIVASTGEMGTASSGSLYLIKTTKQNEDIRVVIKAVTSDVQVDLTNHSTIVKSYYIDTTDGDLSNVCGQAATTLIYYSGLGSSPVQGDIIYTDSGGSILYDGNNSLHVISATSMGAPSSTSDYVGVDSLGRIISSGNCTCSEVAVPVISQGDIKLLVNQNTRILFTASNNPNSWSVVSSCVNYTLNGGVKGAIFTYTDCKGDSQRVTVSIDQDLDICATATPTLVTGTGTYTTGEVCIDSLLPQGITFVNGVLTGSPTESGEFSLEVIATNCFGDSTSDTIAITVASQIELKPVLIDTTDYKDAGIDACGLSGTYDMLYHNGRGLFPEINDMVFFDSDGLKPFIGGSYWYNLDASPDTLQIDSNGIVIASYTC